MLKKDKYSDKSLKLMEYLYKTNFINPDFKNMNGIDIVHYGYLIGAKVISDFLRHPNFQTANFKHFNVPRHELYTNCELSPNLTDFRSQNALFMGCAGGGKTYSALKLAKDYFCISFIPAEYRENKDFFKGIYAQGTNDIFNPNVKKIVFVSEQHCIEMFGRDINGISASEYYNNETIYGSHDLKDIYNSSLLVINDLGNKRAHPQYIETLFSVLDSRVTNMSKTTIFTTNLDIDSLKNMYGERFMDRITGNFHTVLLEGDSKRKFKKLSRVEPEIDFYHL